MPFYYSDICFSVVSSIPHIAFGFPHFGEANREKEGNCSTDYRCIRLNVNELYFLAIAIYILSKI